MIPATWIPTVEPKPGKKSQSHNICKWYLMLNRQPSTLSSQLKGTCGAVSYFRADIEHGSVKMVFVGLKIRVNNCSRW